MPSLVRRTDSKDRRPAFHSSAPIPLSSTPPSRMSTSELQREGGLAVLCTGRSAFPRLKAVLQPRSWGVRWVRGHGAPLVVRVRALSTDRWPGIRCWHTSGVRCVADPLPVVSLVPRSTTGCLRSSLRDERQGAPPILFSSFCQNNTFQRPVLVQGRATGRLPVPLSGSLPIPRGKDASSTFVQFVLPKNDF